MRRLAVALCLPATFALTVGCGAAIPLPVPSTPAAVGSKLAPRLEPPPSEVVKVELGFCSHADLGHVAVFHGHFDASDGAHYHGWIPPVGEVYWVKC